MSASFLDAMNTRAEDTAEYFDADELCEFCGDTDDCLMMCEGCKKSGCTECVKSYIGKYFGDCKECCEKAEFPDGNCWEWCDKCGVWGCYGWCKEGEEEDEEEEDEED